MIRIALCALALGWGLAACGGGMDDTSASTHWDGDTDESTDEPAFLESPLESTETTTSSNSESGSSQEPRSSASITGQSDPTTSRASDSWLKLDPGLAADGGNPQPWSMDNPTE